MASSLTYILFQHAYFFGAMHNASTMAPNSSINETLSQTTPVPEIEPTEATVDSGPPGFGVHSLHIGLYTWNEARVCCENGGHLAIINSVAEAEAVSKLVTDAGGTAAWIGAHDLYEEGQFVTIHGDTLSEAGYDVWIAGAPDNLGNDENCVSIQSGSKLNDSPCTDRYFHICESPRVV